MWEKMGQNGMNERFRGSYIATIDDRGRVKIPAKYLSVLEQGMGREVYLTSVNGDHILFYPMKVWQEIERKIAAIPMRDPEMEEFVSRSSYWGTETEIDPKGRVLIPADLRAASKLESGLLILGKIDYMVIWNKEVFEARYMGGQFSDEKLNRVSRLLNEFSALPRNE
jgi:MraZ protein